MRNIKIFYGFEFIGGNRTCTTGTPNANTGRLSIAGSIATFDSVELRDEWLACGGDRIACTKRELRNFCLGVSVADFEEFLEYNQ